MDKNKTAAINPKNNDDMYLLRKKKKKLQRITNIRTLTDQYKWKKMHFLWGQKTGKCLK